MTTVELGVGVLLGVWFILGSMTLHGPHHVVREVDNDELVRLLDDVVKRLLGADLRHGPASRVACPAWCDRVACARLARAWEAGCAVRRERRSGLWVCGRDDGAGATLGWARGRGAAGGARRARPSGVF